MTVLQPAILEHMLALSDPSQYSVLFRDPAQVRAFVEWCQRSRAASGICRERRDSLHSFVLDPDEQVYCLALSTSTMGTLLRDLAEEYEVEQIRQLLSR